MKLLVAVLLATGLALGPAPARAHDKARDGQEDQQEKKHKKKDRKSGEKGVGPSEPEDVSREITRILRDLQFALEGGSARSFLSLIDAAQFDDYPRFQDMVERLLREDTIRAYFGQVTRSSSPAEGKAQTILDAEMEVGRKDAAAQLQRRRQQLVLDFQRTRRGWRIVNITPRNYFEPL